MRGKAKIILPLTAIGLIGMAPASAAAAPPIGCGSVVTKNVVLQADLIGCTGDGLVVGAPGIRIELNGHRIISPAVDSSSIPVTPGSAGIRNPGYPRVRIDGSQRRGWIAGFEDSVLLTDANRNTVTGLESYDGITLVRSHKATIADSYLGADWLGCDPLTSPAGLRLIDSDRASIRANAAHLGGLGMVLVRSHNNLLQGNESAPDGSDGSGCSGVVLIDADGNRLIGNTTSQNSGDGIFVDAASQRTVIDGNHAEFNFDDGIDIRNRTTTVLNTTNVENRDLGIESVPGVTAGNNRASLNGNPAQCVNVVCSA